MYNADGEGIMLVRAEAKAKAEADYAKGLAEAERQTMELAEQESIRAAQWRKWDPPVGSAEHQVKEETCDLLWDYVQTFSWEQAHLMVKVNVEEARRHLSRGRVEAMDESSDNQNSGGAEALGNGESQTSGGLWIEE